MVKGTIIYPGCVSSDLKKPGVYPASYTAIILHRGFDQRNEGLCLQACSANQAAVDIGLPKKFRGVTRIYGCLLYTSDAADE